MKTIFQILILISFVGLFLLFYSSGTTAPNADPINYDTYNRSEIEKADTNYNDLKETLSNSIPDGYNKYHYRYQYNIKVKGKVDKVTFKLPITTIESGKQYVSKLNISPKPHKIFVTGDNTIAEYRLTNLKTGNNVISIDAIVGLKRYDIDEAKKVKKNYKHEKDLKRYLIAEKGIETNDAYIQDIASQISGNSKEEIVNNIYEFVRNKIHYTEGTSSPSAILALKARRGKCGEFASAMVALCRARNIPARIVSGNIARKENTKHTWVEVYFDEYGWVTYDPTIMTGLHIHKINGVIMKRENVLIKNQDYISSIKNDFSTYYITYSNHDTGYNGDIQLIENLKIEAID